MKKINDLIECNYDTIITGITDDSRQVKNGYLFVATKGYNIDHYDFIDMAIKNGCSFVICDREINFNIPHLVVDKINDRFYELCRKFYDINLKDYNFIGITGTDGKTTTATIVRDLIKDCAYIGTNGLELEDKEISTSNTTPCVSELYRDLKYIKDNNYKNVVMEVSSEALLHDRVKELRYGIVGFTNITGDHLNIHKTFQNYVDCKMKLLDLVKKNGIVIVNGDDPILQKINCPNLYTFGFNKDNKYVITDVKYSKDKTDIYINNDTHLTVPLIGKYNVYNTVMAYLIGLFFGIDKYLLKSRLLGISPIKGRCEFINFGQDYDIVLDYAHTTNGIKNIINTFKNYSDIIVVTGCAGGRDKTKRRDIGKFIINNVNTAIFTMDDPRYESVDDIIDDMVGDDTHYIRITDRVKAIHYALDYASFGSIVLILGKGRDNYMAIEDRKIYYSDYDTIKNYFEG